jgi:HK97 gp10 family phage protein
MVFHGAALDRLLVSPDGDVAKDLTKRAIRVDRAAKNGCPVDTGRLRSSITWEVARDGQGLVALIGTNVDYAIYVELGTRYMRAQPYLRPALGAAT